MKEKLKERTAELEKRLADAQQTSVEMSSKVAEEEVVVRDLRYKLRKASTRSVALPCAPCSSGTARLWLITDYGGTRKNGCGV